MKTAPLAIAHTYYLPHRKRVIGAAAGELGDLLRLVWIAGTRAEPAEPLDGVSTWLDPHGAVWMVIVWRRAVCLVLDVEILETARAALLRASVYDHGLESAHG